jgi:hypothetical protein
MLKEIAPRMERVALVANPATSPYDYFLSARLGSPSPFRTAVTGDFFAPERSEWDSMTLEEHRSDGERTGRVFEEANARYEATKHLRTT